MMPGMDGIQLLRQALEIDPNLVGIIMTGQGTIPTAVEAMKAGAFDYVLKPFDLQTMLPVLDRAMEVRRLRTENVRLRAATSSGSPSSRRATSWSGPARRCSKVVAADREGGPDRRHGAGPRAERHRQGAGRPGPAPQQPAARPAAGHDQLRRPAGDACWRASCSATRRARSPGRTQAKPGLFEVAEGGTLFIDEVAEMAPALQAKLLRVLEDGHYRRVGGTQECHADVRVVAATNKPLEEEQKAGPVPRGPVLPAQRRHHHAAAAARAPRGHPASWSSTSWRPGQLGQGAAARSTRRRCAVLVQLRLAGQRPRAGQRAGAGPDPGRGTT